MTNLFCVRPAPYLLAALLACGGTAPGQDALSPQEDGALPDLAPGSDLVPDEGPDPLAARLEAARAVLAAEGVVDPLPQSGPLQLTYERATIPRVTDNRGQSVRSIAGVVRVLNDGTAPVSLGPGVVLVAEQQTLRPNVVPDKLRFGSDEVRGTAEDWKSYRTVAPGEVVELPATFIKLPGGGDRLPSPLTLNVPYVVGGTVAAAGDEVEGGERRTVTLDVNAYHRGLADLHVRRTGPRDALAVLAVRGELTYLGRFAAQERLRTLANAGARRGLLLWENVAPNPAGNGWGPAVPPLPDPPREESGRSGFDPASNSRFAEFVSSYRSPGSPPSRAGFTEFARAPGLLAAAGQRTETAPGGGFDDIEAVPRPDPGLDVRAALVKGGMAIGTQGPAGDFGTFHLEPTDAAAEVLASALRTLDAATAEALIASAEPLVRPAAVRHAGPNLPPARVPLLIALAEDEAEEPAVRSAAAAALGAFDRAEARATLARLVTDAEDPSLAADAAESLATSRFPKGRTALAETLVDGAVGVPAEVFAVLADHSDPAWEDTLATLAGDESVDPAVRVAALRAVVAGRSAAADRLLAEAVAGDDPIAAEAAFAVLKDRTDPASRRLAETYALEALRAAAEAGRTLDTEIADFLQETRPPAAAEPLWTLFDADSDADQERTIELLAAIAPAAGDPASAAAVGGRLADAWDRLDQSERSEMLAYVADLAPDRLSPLAADALRSGDQSFEQAATSALEEAGAADEEIDRLLIEAFRVSEDEDAARRLALELVGRASSAARTAVLDGRWDENAARREAAEYAVDRLTQFGPAQAFFIAAALKTQVDDNDDGLPDGGPEPHEESLKYLDIALRLDPNLAAGWSQRAFSRGQAGHLEGARDDYRRALELDPYDNLAMTGLAILEIELGGDVDAGLARAEAGLAKYPEDRLFAYNMACVYGVAAKSLHPAIESGEADAATQARFERYLDKAREHLARSYRLGLDGKQHRHHASKDPDLDLLHGDPIFEQVVAGTLPAAPAGDGSGEDGNGSGEDGDAAEAEGAAEQAEARLQQAIKEANEQAAEIIVPR